MSAAGSSTAKMGAFNSSAQNFITLFKSTFSLPSTKRLKEGRGGKGEGKGGQRSLRPLSKI